jgi:CheY-like chemotaxis protein
LVSFRPQVIVSDIEMPTENGYAFLRNLRSVLDEDGGQTPAVALTGRTRPEDRARALAAGFNLHLGKPATPKALLQALSSVVSRSARADE